MSGRVAPRTIASATTAAPARSERRELFSSPDRLSPFHETFGYYAHGVGPETAMLPSGWRERVIRFESEHTGGTVGLCLAPEDLAVSKLLAGREKELVANARAKGFGIWPTLSEPVQVRIGILNQLSEAAITDIVTRFAAEMNAMGANVDVGKALKALEDSGVLKVEGERLRLADRGKLHQITEAVGKEPAPST